MASISIIMPVFNAGLYLRECLDSIVAQREQDWELIAVDDHSTDDSWDILLAYHKRDSRIRVLKNVQKGIITALRLAFSQASGAFITRMDADDKMTSDRLSRMKQQLLVFGKGHLSIGGVKYFTDGVLGNGYKRYESWLNQLTKTGDSFSEIYKECVIPSPCWMVYKVDLVSVGAFDSDIYPEDYDLCFRFYKKGLKVIPEGRILHHWRDYAIRSSRTDPHYADSAFIDIKVNYFLELDWDKTKQLVLWGAGKKGKRIAEKLHKKGIDYRWICNQERKWGHRLHGTVFEDSRELSGISNPQIIVVVASPEEQTLIKHELAELEVVDYFFFC